MIADFLQPLDNMLLSSSFLYLHFLPVSFRLVRNGTTYTNKLSKYVID